MSGVDEVKLWRVFCDTEASWAEVWSPTEPTTCPNNNTHTIDTSKTVIITSIKKTEVQIQEELVATQGVHRTKGYNFTVPASAPGTLSTYNITWDYPITLLCGEFDTKTENIGDLIEGWVFPSTPVGYITGAVGVGDTVLPVSSTVLQYVYLGYTVKVSDGVNTTDFGECIAKDTINSTITVKNAADHTYSAPAPYPAYVSIIVKVVEDVTISNQRPYEFAKKKVGGKALNTSLTFQVRYTNNDGNAKHITFIVEYLY